MPSKGEPVVVEGYGGCLFVGANDLRGDNPTVSLKFEGLWNGVDLDRGYGSGIIVIPYREYKENRIYPEQLPKFSASDVSTEKRDQIFEDRFGLSQDF